MYGNAEALSFKFTCQTPFELFLGHVRKYSVAGVKERQLGKVSGIAYNKSILGIEQ